MVGRLVSINHACLWRAGAGAPIDPPIDLGALGSGVMSWAWSIDSLGRVAGFSNHPDGSRRPILIVPQDTDGDGIGDLWFRDSNADGVNDLMINLGTLGGRAFEGANAWMVHSTGKVVGAAQIAYDYNGDGAQDLHAFLLAPEDTDGDGVPDLWFRDAGDGITNALMVDLNAVTSLPPGCELTKAQGINDSGQIAVTGRLNGNTTARGFLLTPVATPTP